MAKPPNKRAKRGRKISLGGKAVNTGDDTPSVEQEAGRGTRTGECSVPPCPTPPDRMPLDGRILADYAGGADSTFGASLRAFRDIQRQMVPTNASRLNRAQRSRWRRLRRHPLSAEEIARITERYDIDEHEINHVSADRLAIIARSCRVTDHPPASRPDFDAEQVRLDICARLRFDPFAEPPEIPEDFYHEEPQEPTWVETELHTRLFDNAMIRSPAEDGGEVRRHATDGELPNITFDYDITFDYATPGVPRQIEQAVANGIQNMRYGTTRTGRISSVDPETPAPSSTFTQPQVSLEDIRNAHAAWRAAFRRAFGVEVHDERDEMTVPTTPNEISQQEKLMWSQMLLEAFNESPDIVKNMRVDRMAAWQSRHITLTIEVPDHEYGPYDVDARSVGIQRAVDRNAGYEVAFKRLFKYVEGHSVLDELTILQRITREEPELAEALTRLIEKPEAAESFSKDLKAARNAEIRVGKRNINLRKRTSNESENTDKNK